MKADEKAICKRFIQQKKLLGEYWYDVHLDSNNLEIPEYWTKKDIDYWRNMLAKRIDLLIVQEHQQWIFEVTPKLSKAAIGGCLAYKDLYITQYIPGVPVRAGVIVEMDDPTYHPLINQLGITLFVV